MIGNFEGKRCPMCNVLPTKMVPLYDNDQEHKNTMCCRSCKKKVKNNEEIVKIIVRE